MRSLRLTFAATLLTALMTLTAPAQSSQETLTQSANQSAPHDFDFLVGRWNTHHRQLKKRLAGSHDWVDFDGTYEFRLVMGGWGNVGDNLFKKPDGDWRGVSLRSYDPKTGEWAVWWLDGRNPAANLDPPIQGRFESGSGIFYSDEVFQGKPIRVRVIWTHTPTTARWEQAYSADDGKTWETNWITDFERAP